MPTPGRTIEVLTAGRTMDKGAHTYPVQRIITATRATATLMITATTATATITITGITDSLACAIHATAMEAGLDCQLSLTPTIGV